MKLAGVILNIIAMLLTALCTWWAWNEVSSLFTFLPPQWHHLSFMQCFFLAWLLRLITGIVRTPDNVANEIKNTLVTEIRKSK